MTVLTRTPERTDRRHARVRALSLLAMLAGTAAADGPGPADTLFVNGHVLTLDVAGTVVEAVAVRDGRILDTGTDAQVRRLAGPGTAVVDLHGRTVLPGFVDGHAHPSIAVRMIERYLDGRIATTPSVAVLLQKIKTRAAATPAGEWVIVAVPRAIENSEFGIDVQENIAVTDPSNEVVGHEFKNQFQTLDDLEKVHIPHITHDPAETERRLAVAHELFDGLLEVRLRGMDPYLSLWDPIATWMGVENALYALVDQPDLMHGLVGRMTEGYLSMLDQLEEQGLLCQPQSLIHCTGAYTDELPAPGYDPQKPRTKDIWMFGLAQMFSTVSPRMFKEYEVDYASQICGRFGVVYYGCCDPLDQKMAQVRIGSPMSVKSR